jgi:hypothetical protein
MGCENCRITINGNLIEKGQKLITKIKIKRIIGHFLLENNPIYYY